MPVGDDAGTEIDAGKTDSGVSDAGTADSGFSDSGFGDAGFSDAGQADAGISDGGFTDAGGTDAGLSDAGLSDAGLSDAGSTDAGASDAGATCALCAAHQSAPQNLGVISVAALTEISGLAASRIHHGVLYAHNDSGGLPTIYAISNTGALLGELQLGGAVNHDWEDIAVGPCPAGSCIYVGEIGDNPAAATYPYAVYRVTEPAIETTAPIGAQSVSAEKFELQYPGGTKHNAETLLVHPVTGDVYVVTKPATGQKSAVYKATAPLSTLTPNALVKLADLAVPATGDLQLTAGDIHPCGTTLLLRAYNTMYEFKLAPGAAFDSIFTSAYTKVPAPPLGVGANFEQQGEAVSYTDDGLGYFTTSEGVGPQLHLVACQ